MLIHLSVFAIAVCVIAFGIKVIVALQTGVFNKATRGELILTRFELVLSYVLLIAVCGFVAWWGYLGLIALDNIFSL